MRRWKACRSLRGVAHLQSSLSHEALAAFQHAAQCVVQDTPPEVEAYGACYVTPHAPMQLNQGPRVPMTWVRHLSAELVLGEG